MYHERKSSNPGLVWFCDTVIGDRDKNRNEVSYCLKELTKLHRDEVLPLADFVTPNQLELEPLPGTSFRLGMMLSLQ